ncbi:M56 family metallopeptidase [Tundrisphaera lichenicola]|uniref:M56 family metallopeptidase n=1 Tax=Tundrisphaera lichenicola TaxID=2029860 RepID=UPI003EB91398
MLGWFAESTLIAGGLAALVALACRSRRLGPEARHALWLVVMIKLAIPPLVAWPSTWPEARPASPAPRSELPPSIPEPLPAPDLIPDPWPDPERWAILPAPPGESPILDRSDFGRPELEPEPEPAGQSPQVPSTNPEAKLVPRKSAIGNSRSGNWNLRSAIPAVLLGLWLTGTFGVVAFRAFGLARFRRSLRGSMPPPPWLSEEARAIGDRLGVRPPPILVAPGVTTPLLWCLGRTRLIVPASLVDRLGAEQWPGILAHELAHLARRDHWVIRLELLVELVWWWNPIFHLTRRRLRAEAEQAADARVIRALPDRRFAYAEALVDICEHLARSAIPSPALGVGGAEASRTLEGRLLMILRDPIPRPPRRSVLLAAGLLAALSLPSWTLGQQPDPTKASSEAPKAADEAKPGEAPQPAAPSTPLPTLEEIQAGYAKRLKDAIRLGFRYSVASRNRIGAGVSRETVGIQVADVVLDSILDPLFTKLRLDVLSAPDPGKSPSPSGGTSPWIRRFVAREDSNLVTLGGPSTEEGPVPFRWRTTAGQGEFPGDDLLAEFLGNGNMKAVNPDGSVDPLDPRPSNVLDLVGGVATILQSRIDRNGIRVYPAGGEVIDGRQTVRLAWATSQNFGTNPAGLRGLVWVVPSLGFAVVRSESAQDSTQVGMMHGRRFWRKSAGDFEVVGGVWLPRKVESRFVEMGWTQGPPATSRELIATFEDYRVSLELPDDTFHPNFPIEALDEKSGDFTTRPPAPSPGLVERLQKAIAESPYGPPGVRTIPGADRAEAGQDPRALVQGILQDGDRELMSANRPFRQAMIEFVRVVQRAKNPDAPEVQEAKRRTDEMRAELKAAASKARAEGSAAARPTPSPEAGPAPPNPNPGRAYADIVTNVDEAPTGRLLFGLGRLNPTQPAPEAVPAPRLEDPAPEAEPARADPAPADVPLTEERIAQLVESRFKEDPKAVALALQVKEASKRLDAVRRITRTPNDPAMKRATEALAHLKEEYERYRGGIRDEIPVLQARRDGKAAEVRKAEARRDLAKATMTRFSAYLKRKAISREEMEKAEAELRIAEAEVESKQAELAESDLILDQTRRRLGLDPLAEPPPTPAFSAPGGSLADLRDFAELLEVQLQGKRAELQGEEAKLGAATSILNNTRQLHERATISITEVRQAEFGLKTAEAELAQKQAEVREFEVRLKQAQRRVQAGEDRIGRAIPRAKERLEWAEAMKKKGYISGSMLEDALSQYEELNRQLGPTPATTPPPVAPETPGPQGATADPKPGLAVKIFGRDKLNAGQPNEYRISVGNTGTAPAEKVEVIVRLPSAGGRLVAIPDGSRFDKKSRTLSWILERVPPSESVDLKFDYQTSTPGLYRATAEVRSGILGANDSISTDVAATALIDLKITQTERVIDVGKATFYDVAIKNAGSKEATRLQLRGKLTKNLKVLKHFNIEKGEFQFNGETGEFHFPEIERLAVGQSITLTLEVQATDSGPADCHVFLTHAEAAPQAAPVEDVISTTVVAAVKP